MFLKIIIFSFLLIIVIFIVLVEVFKAKNRKTPTGGINKSLYIDINGSKQWINIYGKDLSNPVLLYLHGGPGSSTSSIDYYFTRKYSDVYTIVIWDQRCCGKSYHYKEKDVVLTRKLFLEDGLELTKYLLKLLSKDKISILGHSWGSIYGANLVMEYPSFYDCFIGTGQCIDFIENEKLFKKEATKWAKDDKKSMLLVSKLTPENITLEHIKARTRLMHKYGYDMFANGIDYNMFTVKLFNPYYNIIDWIKLLNVSFKPYMKFIKSQEFADFSLKDRYDYNIKYYNINGDKDYQTNYMLAKDYFSKVKSPYKKLYMMENMPHGLLMKNTDDFSKIIHEIANNEKTNNK